MVWRPHNFVSACKFFLLILHNKRDQQVHENLLVVFFEKKSHLGQFDLKWFLNVWLGAVKIEPGQLLLHPYSQGMISFMITTGPLNSQDMIRIL